ncbi:MAG TPA: GAF domain-containing sensor histidine kinase [Candidatus Saccharimonadales bacterium]|nr:GAF domain-containing sensor histidine kinase [Candidatus Saccharimonadales bacterium]
MPPADKLNPKSAMAAPSASPAATASKSGPPPAVSSTAFDPATQEIYQRNLELAETNKTLLLLRKIDEVVLSSVTDQPTVMKAVATTIAEESGFPFAAIYLRDRKQTLQPQAVVTRIGDPVMQEHIQAYLSKQPIGLRHPSYPTTRAVRHLVIVTTERLFEVVQPSMPIEEAEEAQERLSLVSFYICPLQARNEVIGVMVLGSPQNPAVLGFYQKSLLERLTVAVGIAIDNTLLYREAEKSAAHLRTANRHLKELDKAKDEFITMASHQLRTPLTSIKGYLSMLLEGDTGPVSDQQHEFLEYAYNGSQRMVGLIADLLNVSRMSAGRFVIQKQPVDLAKIVEEEVGQLQRRAIDKQLQLHYLPPTKPLPRVQMDESKTRQVIMNFIDNAVYYTPHGSIEVKLVRHGKRVELLVKDTGIGVPKALQRRLFTKFFRASNAQKVRPDGTGLGLYLAKQVIEDQGGSIIFESIEGEGSTFGFSLPL